MTGFLDTFIDLIAYAAVLLGFALFAVKRLMRYLHIFQQDDYNGARFISWMLASWSFDKRVSLIVLLAACVGTLIIGRIPAWNDDFIYAIIFGISAIVEPDPRREAKKKLVITARARRIFLTALLLNIIVGGILLAFKNCLAVIVAVQLVPLLLVVANIALMPVETNIQKEIMDEATERLNRIKPHIIGVTGSFGKTSVKHILGHILEMNAPTYFTPGSVNTPMGVSRIIRENLPTDCRYFLVEMGAYGEGSIRKLCGLTPPQTGIITAIGEAHYERFKTLDTVARAKFELAEAVLKNPSGQIIVHENVLTQDYAAQFIAKNRDRFTVCGQQETCDVRIDGLQQTSSGLNLKLCWKGQEYPLTVPLFGMHHAGNVALSFATAMTLGITPDRCAAALRSVPQITHRLEVKPQPNGSIYIDDAYNSNPAGFVGALELMSFLAAEKRRRRIIVTPGLVELGEKHDTVHQVLGAAAAKNADIAITVRPERIRTFIDGFIAAKPDGVIYPAADLAEAQKWLTENGKPEDVVLIENDLPDVYERKLAV